MKKPLVVIPTYNEKGNCSLLVQRFKLLNLGVDVLFMDDNSPDGTGEEQDALAKENPWVTVVHRAGKLGIGSAHQDAIRFAYDKGYDQLVTMDADFTHPPETIKILLKNEKDTTVVVGSRHLQKDGIDGWNLLRKIMTKSAHFMTTFVLGLPYDSTNAFRLYNLRSIPLHIFDLVDSTSYSFFYESLFILNLNGISISEIPMRLPPREAGNSKMRLRDVWRSIYFLFAL
ncbi:MAG: glycosyltransferase, partial [Bdellovibrionia bacterium]